VLKSIKSEENANKLIKFLILWVTSYWLNLLITFFWNKILELNTEISYFITIILLFFYQFFISLKIIFKKKFSFKILFKYLLVLFSFSSFNYISVISLKNYFWEQYFYIIIILVITILSIIKFIVYNNFVFNKAK